MPVVRVPGDQVVARLPEVYDVWAAVYGDRAHGIRTVGEYAARPGFRLVIAEIDGRAVGFALGFAGASGQPWTDRMLEHLGPVGEHWLGGHAEFAELAVHPEHRRCGHGAALHDEFLRISSEPTAVLTVRLDNPIARELYLRRGWNVVGSGMRESPGAPSYEILVRRTGTSTSRGSGGARPGAR